ncbi:protein of unknown function [Modestobacter italicus]|uniref:Uncharacterized protein n=1 Tax=Modestobacter italicus (strain DSM 44449 / CECT 9708 / BC 501) TaxID=2732864 RepID=I4F0M9_MODI5|nr:hypothetical protein [Modestobacter marinus]CCH89192.1 protein of unknown function [Modestobacter marinus]
MRDLERHSRLPLAATGGVAPQLNYIGGPNPAEEVDRPPLLASQTPVHLSGVRAWADHLLQACSRRGVAASLYMAEGRPIGSLGMLCACPSRPRPVDRRVIATVIADDSCRTKDIAEAARIVGRAEVGVLLTRRGAVLPLLGVPDDRLCAPGSLILAVALDELARSGAYTTFRAPTPDVGGEQLIRVTALDVAQADCDQLSAAVLLAPPGNLHGLTVLDLRVLGLLVEGVADIQSLGQALHLGAAIVADSLGRSLVALQTSDLTAAAVRALRSGMRIPPRLMKEG